MFTVGQTVAYSTQGICTIAERCTREVGGAPADYYVLKPLQDPRSTVYVPVDNARLVGRMRAPMEAGAAKALLAALPGLPHSWQENDTLRREQQRAALAEGLPEELAQLYKVLLLRRRDLEALSRKLRSSDEAVLKQVEKLLCCECALALGCDESSVKSAMEQALL